MSRSQASSTSSSAPSWLQEFISAVMTQTNLAREHSARSDRTIEDLMERLHKQELRHQQVVDALQKQVAAAGATPLPGAAPSSSLPTSQPYGRLPSPPPPPKLTPDISLRDFRAWKATWEDYFKKIKSVGIRPRCVRVNHTVANQIVEQIEAEKNGQERALHMCQRRSAWP